MAIISLLFLKLPNIGIAPSNVENPAKEVKIKADNTSSPIYCMNKK